VFSFSDRHALWQEYGLEGTLELFQFFSEENCDYPSPSKVSGLKLTLSFDSFLAGLFMPFNIFWQPFSVLILLGINYFCHIQQFSSIASLDITYCD